MKERFIIVCYDIIDNNRRNKIAKILLDYGVRVQYSIFECVIPKELEEVMKRRIIAVIEKEIDKVHYYYLCKDCIQKIEIYGREVEERNDKVICFVI